ncbi:MAG: hypothetical protein D6784_11605 [Chloroflexi bacterium]|nr:MAG: hypothetical protein D6784_11605 [Chloroflexota bacterium]
MNGSWRFIRLGGIGVRLHWSFSLLGAWMVLQATLGRRGWNGLAAMTTALILLFASVLLHELGHAVTARRLGLHVRDIIILPVGGLVQVEVMPNRPWLDLLVAVTGPLVNLVLALSAAGLLAVWGKLGFLVGFLTSPDTVAAAMMATPFHRDALSGWLVFLLVVNGVLFLFNLLPAAPMDGGRMLAAGLSLILPAGQAVRLARRVGQGVVALVLLAAIFLRSFELFVLAALMMATGLLASSGQ